MTKSFKIVLSIASIVGSLFFSSCNEEVLTDLQSQIDALKSGQIASLDAQVKSIQNSIAALETTDTELKEYIKALQAQQTTLAQEDQKLAESIAAVKEDLKDSVSTVRADLMAQLEAHRQTVADQVTMINTSLETLTAKDQALENQIASLKEYTDGEIQKTKDWASATFVTLEKYNETVTLVGTIQEQIAAINTRMEEFQKSLNTLSSRIDDIETDLAKAIADNAAALAEVSANITAAYTEAIATAISASETSLKNWVAGELTAYYTAVQTDAKLAALQAEQDQKLNQQKTYVETLLANLQTVLEGKISANSELINGLQGQINNLSTEAAQLAKSILVNADSIAVNSTRIKENAQSIAQNSLDITACESLIAANKTLIQDNARAIAVNDSMILVLQAKVVVNEQGISNNVENIAKNAADIAVNASLIAANATAISNNTAAIADNAEAIAQLRTDLQSAVADLTDSYHSAIQTAISTLDGRLTGEIATQISTVNGRIDSEVATINTSIETLTGRVAACEADIAAIQKTIGEIQAAIEALQQKVTNLLARIQSISYVPKYSNAKAVMTFADTGAVAPGFAILDFKIQPKTAAAALATVWQEALKVEAVSAETRTAPEVTNLPIQNVTAEDGYLFVIVSGTGLQNAFFTGEKSVFITLVVSDGNNERASEYVPLFPELAITLNDAADLTPVSVTLSGQLGKETARRTADKVAIYYSATESTQAGLLENGTKVELTPTNIGSFSSFLSPLTSDATYHCITAVKDCGQWFYSPVKMFVTLNYTAEAVDMGLPSGLKWASYNLGASSPEQPGAYFAWGETEPKEDYSWKTYKWCNGTSSSLTKYCTSNNYGIEDGKKLLDSEDDVAVVKLGETWRLPTSSEWVELKNNCLKEWTSLQGVYGYLYTSKINGNSIFIPAAGCYNGTTKLDEENNSYCWLSSVNNQRAYRANDKLGSTESVNRSYGIPVRPVLGINWSKTTVTVMTKDAIGIEEFFAIMNGSVSITSDWSPKPTVGFLLSTSLSTIETAVASSKTTWFMEASLDQNGEFSLKDTLDIATDYYFVACAIIGDHKFYGDILHFTTKDYPYSAEAIDMGLPSGLKWASYNLGASVPEETGALFSWGEIKPKLEGEWDNYKWWSKDKGMIKYSPLVDGKTELDPDDDAASVKLGGTWRIPSAEEREELTKNSTIVKFTKDGKEGLRITSNITGNSIFLPTGFWLRTTDDGGPMSAYITDSYLAQSNTQPFWPCPIRPVQDWDWNQIDVSLTTEPVSSIGNHSALLRGLIDVTSALNPNKSVWFLYGEDLTNLNALLTSGKRVGAVLQLDGAFSASTLSEDEHKSLTAGAKYYYVACAKVGTRTFYGDVSSFTTNSYTYTAEAVDMGLSVKWSSTNLGAANSEDDGAFFAWGEIEPKYCYDSNYYKWSGGSSTLMTKYCTDVTYGLVDNTIELEAADDAAYVKLGGNWRMPTDAEWTELMNTDNCTWTWTTENSVNGYRVTSKMTGNSIFLPAAGYRYAGKLIDAGNSGNYWSSSLNRESSNGAWRVDITSSSMGRYGTSRVLGLSVRPVCD